MSFNECRFSKTGNNFRENLFIKIFQIYIESEKVDGFVLKFLKWCFKTPLEETTTTKKTTEFKAFACKC